MWWKKVLEAVSTHVRVQAVVDSSRPARGYRPLGPEQYPTLRRLPVGVADAGLARKGNLRVTGFHVGGWRPGPERAFAPVAKVLAAHALSGKAL